MQAKQRDTHKYGGNAERSAQSVKAQVRTEMLLSCFLCLALQSRASQRGLSHPAGDTPLSKARAGKFMEMYKLLVDGMGGANDLGRNYTLLAGAPFRVRQLGPAWNP